jgi:proline dehydrogenase
VLNRALARVLPLLPRKVVWWVARRYIAGDTLEAAVATVRRLNAEGKIATVDVLGEAVRHVDETHAITAEYQRVLAALDAGALDASVSVKLTALGLSLDLDLCRAHLEAIVRDAAARGRFVRIDMEDSPTVDDTLRLYRELRGKGLDNVGIVLQACLRRTPADIAALRDLVPNVRIVKGIYLEPPAIAFRDFHEVRAQFLVALEALLEAGSFVAIATHDEHLLTESLRRTAGLDPERYEFQMLLGVRPERGNELVARGERLRIYVPYGQHWYAYSLRRLQENPQLAGHIARDTLRRLVRRRSVSRR